MTVSLVVQSLLSRLPLPRYGSWSIALKCLDEVGGAECGEKRYAPEVFVRSVPRLRGDI